MLNHACRAATGIALVSALCVAAPACAVQSQQSPFGPLVAQPGAVPDPAQGILSLDATVTDETGNPVPGLTIRDFSLLDNGQTRPIVSFRGYTSSTSTPGPPVEIILVIDELDLPPIQLMAEEREIQSFLLRNHGQLSQPVCLYRVNAWGLFASAAPSRDGNLLADEIAHKKDPRTIWPSSMLSLPGSDSGGSRTAEHVFLDPTWRELPHAVVALGSIAIEERRKPGRKLMFWLGPGWEINHSRKKDYFHVITELSTRLREARINLWNVTQWPRYDSHGQPASGNSMYQDFLSGVKSEDDATFGHLALQVLAVQSGGGVIQTASDLSTVIAKRVEEANDFYTLTFDPERTDVVDEYHDLRLEVDKPGLAVHIRSAYYDQPVFYDQRATNVQRVTVNQLQQLLQQLAGKSDAEELKQLNGCELIERLSSTKLTQWTPILKSKRGREALIALADQSAFLDPPGPEINVTSPPDIATRRAIIQRTVDYVNKTIPSLPDFFAARETSQYLEPPRRTGETWKTAPANQSLHLDRTLSATVRFRNGREIQEGKGAWGKPLSSEERRLDVTGTFGPILTTVLMAATIAQSELIWSHWEQDQDGQRLAVFRYRVPQPSAGILVGFCCMAVDFKQVPFEKKASFHGEFTINPQTGAVLRLTVVADLEPRLPLAFSGIMVEYAPVEIGGIKYICPVRSVSIARQRTVTEIHEWGEVFKVYAPFETILNDAAFSKYHRFRSSFRILPDYTPAITPQQ